MNVHVYICILEYEYLCVYVNANTHTQIYTDIHMGNETNQIILQLSLLKIYMYIFPYQHTMISLIFF